VAALIIMSDPSPAASSVELLAAHSQLTQRQAEIALWIASGASTVEVAQRGEISRSTVRRHLEAIFQRTGCRTRAQLVRHVLGISGRPSE
jgi:DNA-binding CsgD family transcriptional regulator